MALAAVNGERTLAELSEQVAGHPNQIQPWTTRVLDGADEVFGRHAGAAQQTDGACATLHATIGPLPGRTMFYPPGSDAPDARAPVRPSRARAHRRKI